MNLSARSWGWTAAVAGLILAVVGVYHNSLGGAFLFDDLPAIVRNPTIRSLGWSALRPPGGALATSGRPLINFSLAANYAAGGLGVAGYHAVNLTIHALAALTLFGFTRRTLARRDPSLPATALGFAAALLWAVHPLQTEAVTYIAQRAESLMALCYLFTLYGFTRLAAATEAAARPWSRLGWGLATTLACLLGMAAKEVMVSAPLLVLLYDRTFVSGEFGAAWRRHRGLYLGLFATWVLLAFLTLSNGDRGNTSGFGINMDWWKYWITQPPAICYYFRLALWPNPLVLDYGYDMAWVLHPLQSWPYVLACLLLVSGVVAALWRNRPAGWLGVWFFAVLAPSSLVPGTLQTRAEHRMYLALAPLAIGAVWALARLAHHRIRRPALAVCLALACAVPLGRQTLARNRDYRSELTIWTDTVAKRPDNEMAQYNLANSLYNANRPGDAIPHYQKAVALTPGFPDAFNNLGNALHAVGRQQEAVRSFEQAIRLNPYFPEAFNDLGVVLTDLGRPEEAVPAFAEAVRQRPGFAQAHENLSSALAMTGRLREAAEEHRKATQLRPSR